MTHSSKLVYFSNRVFYNLILKKFYIDCSSSSGYLKKFDDGPHELSLVRIYSEYIEYKAFPPPVEPGPGRKMDSEDVNMDPDLKDISLHYRIRSESNRCAEVINAFEAKFRHNGTATPTDDDLKEYKRNIASAEVCIF